MAINFPASPTNGQTYTANGTTWQWDTKSWNIQGSAGTSGSGTVLQIQYGYYTTQTSTTNTSTYTDLSSVSITPTSNSSKIHILVNYHMSGKGALKIRRNSTDLYTISDTYMQFDGSGQSAWNYGSPRQPFVISLVDNPATTSSTTYTVSMIAYNGGGNGFGTNELTAGQNFNSMILMEIVA